MDNSVSNLHILNAVGQAARDALASQCSDTTAILQEQAGTNLANMANAERFSLNINDNIYRSGLANRESIERNADWIMQGMDRDSNRLSDAIERNGSGAIHTTERAVNYITNLVQSQTTDIKHNQYSIAAETRQLINNHNSKAIEMNKDGIINDNINTGKIQLQASQYFGQSELDIASVKSKLEIQAAQNTSNIQLEALKNKNSLSAQLAECCCELKQIVKMSNQHTQQIIQDIENNRVRDALAAANTENLISKFNH